MADQLKACPFCKSTATKRKKGGFLRRMFWYPGLTKVSCSNDGCGAFFSYWSAEEWNTRAEQVGVTTVQAGDKTSAMHSAVRRVLKHHKLTLNGDGVIEADLIYAVLDIVNSAAPSQPVAGHIAPDPYEVLKDDCAQLLAENRRLSALPNTANAGKEAAFPNCSGDSASCPENEGFGCCKPNAAPQQAVAASSEPVTLTNEFIAAVIQNVCEIPDRNSPDDEPEAMVCTPDELTNCIRRAEEDFQESDQQIFTGLASTNQPVQAKALTDDLYILSMNEDAMEEAIQRFKDSSTGEALKVVFAAQKSLRALLASQPSAQADVAVRDAALELAARRVEADCIGFAREDAQLLKIIADIRALKSAAPTAQPQAEQAGGKV